jgi:uncharacterized protein YecE (DUF72 family)
MVPQQKWADLECLNCIEINSSFYRVPSEKVVEGWKSLPERVGFVIKASKYITHIKRLNDVREPWNVLWKSISPLGDRLRCVLFQLPPSFHRKEENIQRIKDMKRIIPSNVRIAFEFRDPSWFADSVYSLFRTLGWCMAGTLVKKTEGQKWMGNMPNGLLLPPITAGFSYVRVHGSKGFRGELSRAELVKLREKLLDQRPKQSFVMFNNTFFSSRGESCDVGGIKVQYAAVCNAVQFSSL